MDKTKKGKSDGIITVAHRLSALETAALIFVGYIKNMAIKNIIII
jgi:hypothetical protein